MVRKTKKTITPAMVKKDLKHGGNRCLFCGSTDVEGGHPDPDGDTAVAYEECNTCGRDWQSIWTMTGVQSTDDKEEE